MNRRQLLSAVLLSASLPVLSVRAEGKPKARPYPLQTCVVSGDKLGGMGKPFVFEYKGQEVKLCCKSCKAKFDKDANAFLKKIQEPGKK
jgi:hypothetical protein